MKNGTFYQIFEGKPIHILTRIESFYKRLFQYAAAYYHIDVFGAEYFIYAFIKPFFDGCVKQVDESTAVTPDFSGMENYALVLPKLSFQIILTIMQV